MKSRCDKCTSEIMFSLTFWFFTLIVRWMQVLTADTMYSVYTEVI